MSLFVFFMLLIITAGNFLLLFIGWEGVSLISYLLISFWYQKQTAVNAGYKAFLINRVSDLGLLLSIAAIFSVTGSLDYSTLFILGPSLPPHIINLICLLLVIGVMGKSAQIPFHVWLPDAMAGPIPVSALLHSATMVAAGAYLLIRLLPNSLSPIARSVTLVIGVSSALIMGIFALKEFDIKRILAYSTISQFGYIFAGIGVSSVGYAMEHLVNHARAKALLFLAVGVLLMRLNGETDLRKLSQNKNSNLLIYLTFLLGALALVGIPPCLSFFSKENIIFVVADGKNYFYSAALLAGTFITALYIFRVFFLAVSTHNQSRTEKNSAVIIFPLIILALSIFSFEFINPKTWVFLGKNLATLELLIGCLGILCAWLLYRNNFSLLAPLTVFKKCDLDGLYNFCGKKCSNIFGFVFNKYVEDILLNNFISIGLSRGVSKISGQVRKLHSGYIYHYILLITAAVVLLLIIVAVSYA